MKKIYQGNLLITLLALICCSNGTSAQTITDIDGNVYNTVTIGTQVWMQENLKVTKYNNGIVIGTTTPATLYVPNDSTSKYQWAYEGNESNVAVYGRLYTWYAVTDNRNVCPADWHLPSDAEWTTLTNYLGGADVAGGPMKESGTSHWYTPNTGADNSSGFTALPGGYRDFSGPFYNIGYVGGWWSATEYNAASGRNMPLDYSSTLALLGSSYKMVGKSIRCIENTGTSGINKKNTDAHFSVYPNPSAGKFIIESDNGCFQSDNIQIEIFNLLGEKINLSCYKLKTSIEVDISKSPKGIYFVIFHDGEKIYNQKIVLQ